MSRAAPSVAIASATSIAAPFAVVASAWRSLTWRHHAFVLACSLLYAIPRGFRNWAAYPPGEAILWEQMLSESYQTLLIAFPLLLAIAIANQVASDRRPWLPYAIAAVAAPAFGIAIAWWPLTDAWVVVQFGKALTSKTIFVGFVAFGVAYHRRSQRRLAALRAAQIERAQLNRQELELRLQVMQARVEPQFLFNTLTQVERLYDADPALARRMLDDLIVYLRAALPLLRESTSTLAKEIDLARAYLNIVKVRLGDRLTYDIAISDDAEDVRIPPMVLLPLIDHAIVYGLEPSQAGGSIRIVTSIEGGKLRLTVFDSGAGFDDAGPGNDGIQAIRDRLGALYGPEAQLVLQQEEARGTRAVMEIPCERSERADDSVGKSARERVESSVS
jgi:Histidine kinase